MSVPSDHVSEKIALEPKVGSLDKDNGIQSEVASEEHGHLSVGDILRGTASSELTPFERKAALINA
jgi:hypothetical protein